jgi:2-keto-3-deoxy-L-rhamnonate aldolase RhmA
VAGQVGNTINIPPMKKNLLLTKLKQATPVYGTCLTNLSARWIRTVLPADLDFVFLDTEHIATDRSGLSDACWLLRSLGITPIVRIANPDPFLATQALDAGALGIVVPYLETIEQLQAMAGAVKYRPLKGKVLADALADPTSLSESTLRYLEEYNEGHLLIANIESGPALDNLAALVAHPALDGVFVGPHDLSVNLGVAEQYEHPVFLAALEQIVHLTRTGEKHVGIQFWMEPDLQAQWMKKGVDMVIHSSDLSLFGQKLQQDMQIIRAQGRP